MIAQHIASLKKPQNVDHAFVFRAHLGGSKIGFLAWDRLDHPIRPGRANTLRWLSGAKGKVEAGPVAIEMWSAQGGWQAVAGGRSVVNSGAFEWAAPVGLTQAPLLRVRALGEDGVEHITQMMLA